MKNQLAKVYLDDYPIELMGDEARPPLSRIVRAGGKVPARVSVVRLDSRSGVAGSPIGADDVVDRTAEPTKPIYLRSRPKEPAPSQEPVSGAVLPAFSPVPDRPDAPPNADPVIAQLGKGPVTDKDAVAARGAVDQAAAESAAAERQEELRNEEDAEADELEAQEDEVSDRKDSG